jgi:hypothetical protein
MLPLEGATRRYLAVTVAGRRRDVE